MFASAKVAARLGLGAALILAPAVAFAQAQPRPAQRPAQPAPAAPAATPAAPAAPGAAQPAENLAAIQTPWVKLCDNVPTDDRQPPTTKKLCMVVQETRAENGQMLASVQIRELEGERPRLIIAVPVGMSLQPGIRVVLEGQGTAQPQAMRYEVCLPNACFAQMEMPADFLTRMKRSNNLNIQVVNMNNRAISLGMSLQGFAASYDGAPVDPKAYEESQRRLQAELQRRGEEAQRRIQEQQRQQQGAPGAAPLPGMTPIPGAAPLAPPQR
jgi:invasion protein IalB